MPGDLSRFWEDLMDRNNGPMGFRFVLQPVMAVFLAVRDGLSDARRGRPAYLSALRRDAANRRTLLSDGFKSIARVILLAFIMDVIYQEMVFRWFYPLETAVIVFILACLPYLLVRGPVNRISRRRR